MSNTFRTAIENAPVDSLLFDLHCNFWLCAGQPLYESPLFGSSFVICPVPCPNRLSSESPLGSIDRAHCVSEIDG